jgi:signal transduction histidine kinase
MHDIFRYITPIIYFLIVATWLYILIFYFRKFKRRQKEDKLFNLLLVILAIDAFRTIFEGIYFGIRQTALAGFLPKQIFDTLSIPEYVFLPKIITFITGILVLVLILYRWLPADLKQKMALRKMIDEKNQQLIDQNTQLLKAKERAEESDKLKTEFLNNMSHEIRTPMNGIVGFAKLLNISELSAEKKNITLK